MSANTLRSWELRHGFPMPDRTGSGNRSYNPAQLVLLKEALFRAHGNIGAAMALLGADIERYADRGAGGTRTQEREALRGAPPRPPARPG